MTTKNCSTPRRFLLQLSASVFLASALFPTFASAQNRDINVMISGGFSAAYKTLIPQFERETGHRVMTVQGPSMGASPAAIPNRLAKGEQADVLIMADEALSTLLASGAALKDTHTPLANSLIGMAVKSGMAAPDIGTAAALTATLLNAKSVVYSASASGVYIQDTLFPRLGIADRMKAKSRTVSGEPVAAVVARGDAELAFQQVSELLPIPGITFVGKIPSELQKVTVFSAAVVGITKNREGADALIRFLTSASAEEVIARTGLEPLHRQAR